MSAEAPQPPPPPGTSGLRCSICGETWPPEAENQHCPQCGEPTDPFSYAAPTKSSAEAATIRKHRLFQEYLEQEGRD